MANVATSDRDLPPGTALGGKYRIESLIAEGGMSNVFVGRDVTLDERVAIKVLKSEFRSQKDVLARFVREAKTIRRIQSEHCVKVLDVGMDDAHGPFLVMEYLDGLNLRDILDADGKLTPRRACELVVQVCEALAAAHTSDCIHRDIKPDNVIVLSRGDIEEVRVLDFGISKHALTGSVLNQDLSLISTISLMGTPMYMSPEQMRSTSGTDWRTDIWSVGAMLYEMLTGRAPFESESITEVCSMVLEDEPAPVDAVEPAVPPELARVVHCCLQKRPDDRFQNVGELAVALLPFVPRRARASVEGTLSTLAAAGVQVETNEVSQHPPSGGITGTDVSIPPAASVPSFALRHHSTGRASSTAPPGAYRAASTNSSVLGRERPSMPVPSVRPSGAPKTPSIPVEPAPQRRRRPALLAVVAAALVAPTVLSALAYRASMRAGQEAPRALEPAAAVSMTGAATASPVTGAETADLAIGPVDAPLPPGMTNGVSRASAAAVAPKQAMAMGQPPRPVPAIKPLPPASTLSAASRAAVGSTVAPAALPSASASTGPGTSRVKVVDAPLARPRVIE